MAVEKNIEVVPMVRDETGLTFLFNILLTYLSRKQTFAVCSRGKLIIPAFPSVLFAHAELTDNQ